MNAQKLRTIYSLWIIACSVLGTEPFAQAAQPRITVQPSSQTVHVFDRATLRVSATGDGPLGCQWQRNEIPLQSGGRFSGTDSPTFSIAEVLPEDAGVYSVVVTNTEGLASSSNAVVAVVGRLQIRRSATSPRWVDGSFHLEAATFQAWPHLILESSEDLQHWGRLQTNTAADGLAEMVTPVAGRFKQFYRVQLSDAITLTILDDNYRYAQGTAADWGFSCLIEGTEKTILFDTGGTASTFFANVVKLRANLATVDELVISHDHQDHTAALQPILRTNNQATVWLPYSSSAATTGLVRRARAVLRQEKEAVTVCNNVYLSGEIAGSLANEQALVLDTSQGLVVIVGCSHPGVVTMLQRVKQQRGRDIYWVIGGFHLIDDQANDLPQSQILPVIEGIKRLGVKKCSPTHCTGDRAIGLFKVAFGDDYEAAGTGSVIVVSR